MLRSNRYRLLFLVQVSLLLVSALPDLRAQWVKLSAFNDGTFYNEVLFYDQNLGFITGHSGSVLRTVNGGSTWTTVTLPNANFSANRDICFVSSSDGFISGEDGIWKTANGGATWTAITPAGATTIGSSSSWFRNASVGIWGYGHCLDSVVTFWRTTDGGANWTSVTLTHTPDVAVGGMTYTGGTFYVSGSSGKFWKSTDDGATWTLSNTNSGGWQEDLNISPSGSLHIASADGTSCNASGGGKLLTSTNGGSSWTTTSYANTVMWGVSMYSATNGWAVGDFGKAYKTTDGGFTWTESSCGLDPADRLDDVFMIDATHGFAVGDGIYRFASNEFVARPDTIDFGDVVTGTTAGDSIAAVKGIGTTGTITARAILGADAAHFSSPSGLGNPQAVPDCIEAITLVRFQPTTTGPKLARLEFTIAGLSAPLVVYLKGRGVKPKIVGPKSHRLDTLLCESERIDTLVFTNEGDHPLSIDSVVFANDVGTFTLLSPVPPFEIAPLRREEFIIRGRAAGTGLMSGRMYIYTNDPDYKDTTWMTALAMYRKRIEFTASDDTLIIPSRPPDSTSNACLVIRNTGEADMTAGAITTTSGDPTISTAYAGPKTVKAGDSLVLCFNARAADTMARCKRFRIISQPCGIETFITVCYQAAEGTLDLPDSRDLSVGCGETRADTFHIHNRGNASASLEGAVISGADKDAFALHKPDGWPAVIPVGDSLEVIVSFTPDGSKASSQAMLVVTMSDGSRDSVQLTGTLLAPIVDLKESFNDIGAICPVDQRSIVVDLSNRGTAGTTVLSVKPLDTENRIEITSTPTGAIQPNAADSIIFLVRGSSPGAILARYEVLYDSPCLDSDTITIAGRVLDSALVIAPSPIDFGVVPVTKSGVARTTVRNTSDSIVKVSVGDPGIAGVTVTHPASDVELAPGDTLQITLQFSPDSETTLNGSLPVAGLGRCDEEYAVPIRGSGVAEAVYLSGDLDLGTVPCGDVAHDTIHIYNQSTGAVRIASVVLSDDRNFSWGLPQAPPLAVAPGDSAALVITVLPGSFGPVTTTVTVNFDQGPVTELTAVAKADRRGTDTRFVERDGSPLDSFLLPPMSRCRTSFDTVLILRNTGNIADTLDLTTQPVSVLSISSPLPVVVEPGETKEISIRVDLASRGTFAAAVRGLSRVCGTETGAKSSVDFVALEAGAISFGDRCIGRDSIVRWTVRNPGGYPVTVREVVVKEAGPFTVASGSGFELAPHGAEEIALVFAPVAEEAYAGTLMIVTDAPCLDTTFIQLAGNGVECSIPELILRAGSTRGRWGTATSVPVTISGFNLASAQELKLKLTAASAMLHPENVRVADWAAGRWSVAERTYDPSDGTLSITLQQALIGAPEPSNVPLENETFFVVDYAILRGDSVSTDLDLEHVSNVPDGTVVTEDGEFVLEDYCDAYGRLLSTTGDLALRTSVPNPARTNATIEYELPFNGHAVLSIFDLSGSEVLRLLDDVVPAGRRLTTVDVSDLPSGIYTVRLTIGLQTLTQRMVVAK